MNIDLDDASCVAYECASRLYKTTQENNWGTLAECRVSTGIDECEFIATTMMIFLLTDNTMSYSVRVAALKSAVNIVEGVVSRSKTMGNAPAEKGEAEFIKDCQKQLNVHALCAAANRIGLQMHNMQRNTLNAPKKHKI